MKKLTMEETAALELPNLRLSPPGAVVTQKVRITKYLSFDGRHTRETKEGLNGDTKPEDVPTCLRGEALPKFPKDLLPPRKNTTKDAYKRQRLGAIVLNIRCSSTLR